MKSRLQNTFVKKPNLLAVTINSLVILAVSPSLHAQTPKYWNVAGTSLWNTNANWNSASDGSGTTGAPANSITTNSAVFSVANGNTIAQLSADRSIQGITFNNTGTTAINSNGSGNWALTLGAGGLTLNSGAGAVTFGTTTSNQRVTFTIGADQTWTNNSSNALAFNTNNTISTNGKILTLDGTGGFGSAGSGIRLQGTGSTVKNGDGGLFIANNTQSGDFTLNSGSISPQVASNAFGTGILKINGGSISTTGGNRTFGNSAYELNGTVLLSGGNSIHSLSFNTGAVSLLANSTIDVTTITANMNTAISGGFGLTKGSAGTLILAAVNTYTGTTTISGGKILMTNASALQYSAYNTTGSTGAIGLDVTSGLSSGTLTLGGLAGGVDVATAITGYGSVTGLVLNPQGTQSNSYSGVIANGFGAMTLTKTGAGTQTLTGDNTYSGATTVSGGTLALGHNNAAGTAGITVSGASSGLKVNTGITIANNITVSNSTASVVREVASTTAYNVGTTGTLRSDIVGGIGTSAKILDGISSSASTLTMDFSDIGGALRSDVFTIANSVTFDAFVLQLTTSPGDLAADSVLGWKNGGIWEWAIDGNTGTNTTNTSYLNYQGSFASFITDFGAFDAVNMLGAYGLDTTSGSVWAVVDHGGSFTVVPEPTSALAGILLCAGMFRRRR